MYLPTTVKNPFSEIKFERKHLNREQIISKVWEVMLYLFCFFPYTMWISYHWFPKLYTASDTQPYALIFSTLFLLIYIWKEPMLKHETILILCFEFGVSILAILSIKEAGVGYAFKTYSTYVSAFVIPAAIYIVLKKNHGLNERLIKCCIWIWFAVGFIQKYFIPNFGNFWVIRQTTSSARGVVGCATEPTHYGTVCVFMMLIAYGFLKNRWLYIGILLIQIMGFAGSTISLMYIGVYLVAIALNQIVLRKKFAFVKSAGIIFGGTGMLYYIYTKGILPVRMNYLLGYIFDRNWKKFFGDGSVRIRVSGIVDSLSSFIENHGMPQLMVVTRLNSGIGILLMECGFLAIFYLVAVAVVIYKAYPRNLRFIFVFGFMVIMFSTITFSSPMVGFYLGYCMYLGWERERKERTLEGTLDL